jgi:PAS domain S-box-containing protein
MLRTEILLINGKTIDLTGTETRLLLIFALSPNETIERSRLQKEIWEDEGVIVGRSLDMFISKLRKKLELDPNVKIVVVRGKGISWRLGLTAFEKILGWDNKTLLTTSFFDLVHPDDIQITQKEIQSLAEGKNTINFTHRFRAKNGSYKILQWVATPEPLTGSLFAIARDVSEEKLKEKQLVLSEERARAFFENSQGFMCTHDLNGNFKSVNGAGATILGYSREEILNLSLFDIIPSTRKDFFKSLSRRDTA